MEKIFERTALGTSIREIISATIGTVVGSDTITEAVYDRKTKDGKEVRR